MTRKRTTIVRAQHCAHLCIVFIRGIHGMVYLLVPTMWYPRHVHAILLNFFQPSNLQDVSRCWPCTVDSRFDAGRSTFESRLVGTSGSW